MFVIAGNSIEELENDLEMMKIAMGTGKTMAIGGVDPEEVENCLEALKHHFENPIMEEEDEEWDAEEAFAIAYSYSCR